MVTLMSTNPQSAYKKLIDKNRQLIIFGSTAQLVQWDMETMMPAKAVELRSEQLALLSEIHHKMSTSPAIGKLLDTIKKNKHYNSFSEIEKRNVHLIKKNYDEQTKLPTKLVTQITKQQAITVNTWKKAKAQKNFALFKPELEKLVDLNRKAADILMKVKQTKTPYDALIDIYEPNTNAAIIDKTFTELQEGLKTLLGKIQNAQSQPLAAPKEHVSGDKQREIAKLLMQALSFEVPPSPVAAGRLDETEHPFTAGYYDDVRITTHYHEDNYLSSIFSVLHETGHALYEQALPQEWKFQPIGSYCSMGFHESQSRLYENMIGRSREFWKPLFPKLQQITGTNLTLDSFIRQANRVQPSKIRIEADEVTYCLHIIIRFQIEQALFNQNLKINELPAVWNQKYQEILGMKIENDTEGVMQDTHWASGLYGYFPTYALGNLYAGQLLAKLTQDAPAWRSELEKDNLTSVKTWLANHIYNYGNLYDPTELIQKAVGNPITVQPFLQYLTEKYRELYGF
jgi:carboxypeptidase Taq